MRLKSGVVVEDIKGFVKYFLMSPPPFVNILSSSSFLRNYIVVIRQTRQNNYFFFSSCDFNRQLAIEKKVVCVYVCGEKIE